MGNGLRYSRLREERLKGENNTYYELLGGINKSQAAQAGIPDFQWVRDDYPLGGNILNISGEVIPSLENCDTMPFKMKVIEE